MAEENETQTAEEPKEEKETSEEPSTE